MDNDNVWMNFSGCKCLKLILIRFGYDSLASLKCINGDLLSELEKEVEKDRNFLQSLPCDHKNIYLENRSFQLLPGHRALVLDWCQNQIKTVSIETFNGKHPAFPPILSEIIGNALSNYKKPPKTHRYSEVLFNFSIYLFIMAGKACYETISVNLGLPKAGTICKFISYIHVCSVFV